MQFYFGLIAAAASELPEKSNHWHAPPPFKIKQIPTPSIRPTSDTMIANLPYISRLKVALKRFAFYHNLPVGTKQIPELRSTTSSLCKQADFLTDSHARWCSKMKEQPRFHRKQWEFAYILESLYQRGMLAPRMRGLGFAVGSEPLPSVMCSFGCKITATDLEPERSSKQGWTIGNQLCFGVDQLNKRSICPQSEFDKLCHYRAVDMNAIPEDLADYDFNWSSCSFEHLGSIQKGLDFLRNQLETLKPGGWAVHTTEYNVSSDNETLETENTVIFRQRDIAAIIDQLKSDGHFVEAPDYSLGWMPYDYKVDFPPYSIEPHLRLKLGPYIATSIGLIIRKKL